MAEPQFKIRKLTRRQRRWLEEVLRDLVSHGYAERQERSQIARDLGAYGLIAVDRRYDPVYHRTSFRVRVTSLGLEFVEPRLAASYLLGAGGLHP